MIKVNFFGMDFFSKGTGGLLLASTALKSDLLLSTLAATLPHSVITNAHSDDSDSSRNI